MITRFRIEGKAADQEELREELQNVAVEVMNRLRVGYEQGSTTMIEWECTQDVIAGKPGNYNGRVIFVYRGEHGEKI